jgi:2-isopropylmalate synthase
MRKKIIIFDTTLRDGEQSPGASMSNDQKLKIASALERLGVDRIEAGFPVSSKVQFEAVRRIGESIKKSTIVALARCVNQDIDAAYEALKTCPNRMLHLFLASSPIHREYKLKMSKEQVLNRISEKIKYASGFFEVIEFSPEDASRTEPEFLYQVIRTALESGARVINIPDTVGYSIPEEFHKMILGIRENIPQIRDNELSVHCHNDLGLAVANSLAALSAGADQVEVTINGIGERAGNCSLEELVMAIQVRNDLFDLETGIDKKLIYQTSLLLQNITGLLIPRNKPIIGENAFLHESGIHQHGVIERKETYEIMKPEHIGRSQDSLVMGRHSGKHSFQEKLNSYGIELKDEDFQTSFERFQVIADRKKEVFDEDMLNIVSSVLGTVPVGYKLIHFHTYTGSSTVPTATVKIGKMEEEYIASETGDGPVDALFRAIEKALKIEVKLKEYIIHAIGSGKDSQGQVKVIVEIHKEDFAGRGSSTDIMEASASAYINAINHYLMKNSDKGFFYSNPLGNGKWPSKEVI